MGATAVGERRGKGARELELTAGPKNPLAGQKYLNGRCVPKVARNQPGLNIDRAALPLDTLAHISSGLPA